MSDFQISDFVDKEKVFMVNLSKVEGRLDPLYYSSDVQKFNKGNYKSYSLNRVCLLFKSGFGAGKNDQSDSTSGKIHIRPTNIDNEGNIKLNKNVYVPVNKKADTIKKNSVLFNNTNSQELVGKTAFGDDAVGLYYSNHITKIEVNENLIEAKYLQIILNAYQRNRIFFSICTNWNNQSGVGIELLKSLKIPVPPKKVQQQIIKLYETAYTQKQQKEEEAKQLLASIDDYLLNELGITLREKDNSLENRIYTTSLSKVSGGRFDPDYYKIYYEDLNKSVLNSQYSISKIKDVITFIESGSRPKGGVGNISSGVFSIGGEHVNEKCEVGNGKAKYIPLEFHKKYLLTETKLNDIILVKDGATTGKIGIIEDIAFQKQNINEHVFLIRPEIQKISALYLLYYLHTAVGQDLLKREITGATVTGLTKYSVKNIPIPLPKKEKQAEIANHISEIRAKAKLLEQQAKEILEKAKQEVEQIILGAK